MILGESPLATLPLGSGQTPSGDDGLIPAAVVSLLAPTPATSIRLQPPVGEGVQITATPATFRNFAITRLTSPEKVVAIGTTAPISGLGAVSPTAQVGIVALLRVPQTQVTGKATSIGIDTIAPELKVQLTTPQVIVENTPSVLPLVVRCGVPFGLVSVWSGHPAWVSPVPAARCEVRPLAGLVGAQMSTEAASVLLVGNLSTLADMIRAPTSRVWITAELPQSAWNPTFGSVVVFNTITLAPSEYRLVALDVATVDGEVRFLTAAGVVKLSEADVTPIGIMETGKMRPVQQEFNIPKASLGVTGEGSMSIQTTTEEHGKEQINDAIVVTLGEDADQYEVVLGTANVARTYAVEVGLPAGARMFSADLYINPVRHRRG
jgi:hypothetical protein